MTIIVALNERQLADLKEAQGKLRLPEGYEVVDPLLGGKLFTIWRPHGKETTVEIADTVRCLRDGNTQPLTLRMVATIIKAMGIFAIEG